MTSSGQVSAVALFVRRRSEVLERAFGRARSMDAVFLLASITKPMTVTALMLLSDRNELSLSDPVKKFIPEFRGSGRESVLLKHLVTHTSGLPDMLPEDRQLREQYAPLSEFVEHVCRTPLLFQPGSELRYQSMGILLAGEIIQRVSRQSLPSFAGEHIFGPLGMHNTSIGLGGRAISQTMLCDLSTRTDWDWNSSYWRNLASPWGGALGSALDVERLLQYFSDPDGRVVKPETARAMITNQTRGLNKHWGLGWMLNDHQFGSGCSSGTFGHSGSTGTLCWLDPKKQMSFVLLTTKPAKESEATLLHPVSDRISESA